MVTRTHIPNILSYHPHSKHHSQLLALQLILLTLFSVPSHNGRNIFTFLTLPFNIPLIVLSQNLRLLRQNFAEVPDCPPFQLLMLGCLFLTLILNILMLKQNFGSLIVYQIATAVVFIAILSGSTKQQVTEFRGTDQQLLHLRVVKLRLSQACSVQFRIKYSQFPERKVSPQPLERALAQEWLAVERSLHDQPAHWSFRSRWAVNHASRLKSQRFLNWGRSVRFGRTRGA